jgi:hypothetical protein
MIINMPTNEELAVAQQQLVEMDSQHGSWFSGAPQSSH